MGFITALPKRVGKLLLRPIPIIFLLLFRLIRKPTRNLWILFIVLGLFGFMFWVLYPFSMTDISTSQRFGHNGMTLGLDLKGGTHLLYEANLDVVEGSHSDAMEGAIGIIEDRIDKYGVTEPLIQQQGDDRILVQLPGVEDIDQAKELLGQTARLDFRELSMSGETAGQWIPAMAEGSDGEQHHLTGEYFKPNTHLAFGGAVGNEPEVVFELTGDGPELFEEITGRLQPTQDPLGIFLDDTLISSPRVQAVLSDGGVITGLTIEDAETLVIQLNSGILPVPLGRWNADHTDFNEGEPMFEDTVSATLGEEFVERSIVAFLIGLGLVVLFMILYYRLPGVLASLALIIYAVTVLAIFKLLPVTLTLAGVGGVVLSIGMAVDANVLIFERMKEELRMGRTLKAAIDVGFERAWVAILHSNVSTMLICVVLYWFGSNIVESPQVKGFALTLLIGVALSMLSAIVITRTLLRFFTSARMAKRNRWFGAEPSTTYN